MMLDPRPRGDDRKQHTARKAKIEETGEDPRHVVSRLLRKETGAEAAPVCKHHLSTAR